MSGSRTRLVLVPSLAAAWLSLAAGAVAADAAKIDLKLDKGDTAAFTVSRTSQYEGTSSRGEFKSDSDTSIQYRIQVADKKENGDLVLHVTYGPVKVTFEGSRGSWEFDSSETGEGDEAATSLRDVLKRTITVTVSAGAVKEVSGFPEVEPGAGGGRGRMVAGRFALQRDLELFLSPAVIGKPLEKGKVYRRAREEPSEGEGRRFRGLRERLAYTYEEQQKAGRGEIARFSLAADTSEGAPEGTPDVSREVKGSALLSLRDGLLRRLNFKSSSVMKGERDGQSFSFSGKSTVTVRRTRPEGARPAGKGRAEGKRPRREKGKEKAED